MNIISVTHNSLSCYETTSSCTVSLFLKRCKFLPGFAAKAVQFEIMYVQLLEDFLL